ncbi:hypothetical protein B5S33_g1362 [[Candida] boidinii]|nr:hypothetical protein B5S33_g1362 [[Candida] boidinii]
MFSLFSSKQSTSSINPSKTPIKVIDFNTTNKSTTKSNNNNNNNNTLPKNEPNIASISKSKFRLWPFTSLNEPAVTTSVNNTTATITNTASDNITNIDKEVIAMKLVKDNKLTDNNNDIDNHNDDDEFIDIQVRKLSYAEIASLSVDESKKQLKSMKSDKKLGIDDGIKVIEDNELGKSISDFEFKECYNKINKFDRLNYEELILNNNDYNNNNQINNETANLINEDDELIVDLKQIKKHSKKFNKRLNKKNNNSK